MDLLPESAVKQDVAILQQLGLVNRVIITLSINPALIPADRNHQEELQVVTRRTGERLLDSSLFSNVIFSIPQEDDYEIFTMIHSHLPLLLNGNDLKELDERTAVDEMRQRVDTLFKLINSPAGIAIKKHVQIDPLGMTTYFLKKLEKLKAASQISINNGLFLSKDGQNSMIIAECKLELTDAQSAVTVNKTLQQIFQQTLPDSISSHIIGSLPHTLANAQSIKRDLQILLPTATLLLLILLITVFRSFRAVVVFAVPFLAAPPAIIFTTLVHNQISALALGFGIVLLGIGVDFSIHIYYGLSSQIQEERKGFLMIIKKPLLLATATTCIVFLIVLLSDVPSHRQMATLALFGILLAVYFSWLIIPAVTPQSRLNPRFYYTPGKESFGKKYSHVPVILWSALIVLGAYSWSHLHYNGDIQTLDTPSREVLEDDHHHKKIWGTTGNQVILVSSSQNLEIALQHNYMIYSKLENSNDYTLQTIAPLLPSQKDQQTNLASWRTFWENKHSFPESFMRISEEKGFSNTAFAPFIHSLSADFPPSPLKERFPGSLQQIMNSMIKEIPDENNPNSQNLYRIITTVTVKDKESYSQLASLDTGFDAIHLLSNRKWKEQIETILRKDMVILSSIAAIVISSLVLLVFRRIRVSLAVLAPVISSLSAMAVFCRFTGNELNMMHLLMGIMVIGLAVDYGIFAASFSVYGNNRHSLSAISVCALSSLIGFGVLALAEHPALHSLGVTVLIGVGAAWPTAVIISPLLLSRNTHE